MSGTALIKKRRCCRVISEQLKLRPFSIQRLVKACRVKVLGAQQKSTKTKEVNESDLCKVPPSRLKIPHTPPLLIQTARALKKWLTDGRTEGAGLAVVSLQPNGHSIKVLKRL